MKQKAEYHNRARMRDGKPPELTLCDLLEAVLRERLDFNNKPGLGCFL